MPNFMSNFEILRTTERSSEILADEETFLGRKVARKSVFLLDSLKDFLKSGKSFIVSGRMDAHVV